MEKFFIYAKNPEKKEEFYQKVQSFGFEKDEENPDFIITLGGDGTFIDAEREHPGIPKLLVRDSNICFKCHDEPLDKVLEKVKEGAHDISEHFKIEAEVDGKKFTAVNDVVLRNKEPTGAIRFKVRIDGEESDLLIGDGVVVSTPFGSTAYHYSITKSPFDKGIGIAYNNLTIKKEHEVVGEDAVIEIELERGVAHFASDNNPNIVELKDSGLIKIRKSSSVSRIITT